MCTGNGLIAEDLWKIRDDVASLDVDPDSDAGCAAAALHAIYNRLIVGDAA